MGEDIGAAVVRLDEAEALIRVEPFNGAFGHYLVLFGVPSEPAPCGLHVAEIAPDRISPENKNAPEVRAGRRT
ncbi:hypothetical protein GCM10023196_002390 [Actinoallomurus vinaceus]|uniref:Uncharacterized protein n=1 Tax=Actinoallomurus vinaceus TaxID=1080074 RepID=A0ABP8U417_9ACTN